MKHTSVLARPALAVAVLAALATVFTVLPNVGATAKPTNKIKQASVGIWADSVVPAVPSRHVRKSVTLGLEFSSETAGKLYGVQYYAAGKNRAATTGQVWNDNGKRVAKIRFPKTSTDGWKTAWFSSPVTIKAGRTYTAAYRAARGHYAIEKKALGRNNEVTANGLTAHRGTISRGPGRPTKSWRGSHYFIDVAFVPKGSDTTTDPTPTPTPPPTTPVPSPFPDASNTGVPDGVALGTYSGGSTISTPGTVIDAQQVNTGLTITAPGVVISRSSIDGNILIEEAGSVTITDSLVDGGTFDGSAVGQYNVTMKRTEVIGARQSVSCIDNCDIQDSWLHAQYIQPGSDWHGDGFTSNGGDNVLLRHNTLACDSKPTTGNGACSAAVASYGDFAPITNHTYDNNLFVSSPAGYCMYAGYDPAKPYGKQARNVVVTNNVFARGTSGKCAVFGPVAAVGTSGNGNVFTGNVWDDGKAIKAP